jgi:hypothetical protein
MPKEIELLEAAIISDLMLEPDLAERLPHPHDYAGMKGGDDEADDDERPYTITVSAEDHGDWKGAPGAGIKLVGVKIEVTQNVGADPSTVGPKHLADLAEKVSDRMPATHLSDRSRHQAFCSARLAVYMIMAAEAEPRGDEDLTRTRTIARSFVCAQIG